MKKYLIIFIALLFLLSLYYIYYSFTHQGYEVLKVKNTYSKLYNTIDINEFLTSQEKLKLQSNKNSEFGYIKKYKNDKTNILIFAGYSSVINKKNSEQANKLIVKDIYEENGELIVKLTKYETDIYKETWLAKKLEKMNGGVDWGIRHQPMSIGLELNSRAQNIKIFLSYKNDDKYSEIELKNLNKDFNNE